MVHTTETIDLNIVAEIDLVYKSKVKASLRPKIVQSKTASDIFRQYWSEDKIELLEEFKVLMLNRANKVLGIYHHSGGGMNYTLVDPKLIFVAALKVGASGIILGHNHPSGSLIPSNADRMLTDKIKAGGKLLDIMVMDHIIITPESYMSFADEGLL